MGIRIKTGLAVLLVVFLSACGGGGGGGGGATGPSVPTGLAATGSLGHIVLNWNASTGGNLTGYNVYRSTDGTTFTKLNSAVVTATTYDDAVPSPANDGILYTYRVTAMGDAESAPSSTVRSMEGTRLAPQYAAGFTTVAANSPYVAEGTVVVDGGNLVVDTGTKLYVLDNATIDLEQGDGTTVGEFDVKGLLRVAASATAPATFTAHSTGGALTDGQGFILAFDGADSYIAGTGAGTLVQNTQIANLTHGNAITFGSSSPKLADLKVSSNQSTGGSYLVVLANAGPIIENCSFDKMVLSIQADARSTTLKVDHNTFSGGYYSLAFFSLTNPGITSGQIAQNEFDGTKQAYLYMMTGTANVPIGSNYWNGGTGSPPLPPELYTNCTISYDFTPALTAAPANAGPTW